MCVEDDGSKLGICQIERQKYDNNSVRSRVCTVNIFYMFVKSRVDSWLYLGILS
jgi:hypothetical protein